ncbi:MAG: hypothetical protein ACRDZ1_14085 [Acidimicrobiia bacterium]
MTPTLIGRIQTRVFVVATVGSLWTLIVTPFLPGVNRVSTGYAMTFRILLIVLVAGIGWELVYHGLQQFRWEKDWPTLFGLLNGINEGVLVWLLVVAFGINVPGTAFLVHFTTTWIVLWLFVNGPIRVVFIRWRYRGGRVI